MTNEPKVRADISGENIYVHIKYENESEMIYGLIAPTYKVKANEKINELIASKINAPDPIAIRQQALKEVEQKVIQERNISVVKTRTTGYETAELIGFDKAIGVIKQAIDQLRRGGSE